MTTPNIQKSVFISHRKADSALAAKLAEDVRAAGFIVWLDEWELSVGDSIVEEINKGLEGAAYLVLCYSQAGVLSPWISREWMSALSRQLEAYGIKILPVRLSGGEPPAILADVKYADMVKDWTKGVQDLLRAMKK